MPVGRIDLTVTVQVVLIPLTVLAVIVVLPGETAVTRPFVDTLAIAVFELVHVTVLSVALDGVTVAVSCCVLPISSVAAIGVTAMPVGRICLTVTVHVVLIPLTVLAVIVVLPGAIAVTTPLVDTVAMAVFELVHVTVLSVALDGVTVAVSCCVLPTSSVAVVGVTVMPVGRTETGFTVTVHNAANPLTVLAVIVALPGETAVTRPLADTFAIAVFELVHVTVLSVALDGVTVGVSC